MNIDLAYTYKNSDDKQVVVKLNHDPIMVKKVEKDSLVAKFYMIMPNSYDKHQIVALSDGSISKEFSSIKECLSYLGRDCEVVEDGWKACVLAAQYQDKENQIEEHINDIFGRWI